MKILINTSNIKKGGAIQVAHSFLNEIRNNTKHTFHIVLSFSLKELINIKTFPANFFFYYYSIKPNILNAITGKDVFLDGLERKIKPDKVFSVFAPTYWKPSNKHIAGFAKAQYLYKDSPYYNLINWRAKLKLKINEIFHLHNFKHFCDELITESNDVSNHLNKLFPAKKIHTVTNYYNQIFDTPTEWDKSIILPEFEGITLLTIAASYPHKNLNIIPKVISYLKHHYPDFSYRFVITIDKHELQIADVLINEKILFLGKVDIAQCPFLYQQSDFMFLPTLLECFSASYPEAMRMQKPILTSDLPFARGLCKNAAIYFDPLSVKDIANKIVSLSENLKEQKKLINLGIKQLKSFDTSAERAKKYLKIIEES